jgi:hypothetical protein
MKPVLNSSNAYFAKLSKYLRCVKTFNVGNFFISVCNKTKTHNFFILFPLPKLSSYYQIHEDALHSDFSLELTLSLLH